MSGGYGAGRGQGGYSDPGYTDDGYPASGGRPRGGHRRQRDPRGRQPGQPGMRGQEHAGQAQDPRGYPGQGYPPPGERPPAGGYQYPPAGPQRPQGGTGPQRPQAGTGPQRPQGGTGPQRPQAGTGPQRPQAGTGPQRRPAGTGPYRAAGAGGYDDQYPPPGYAQRGETQRGYRDWDPDQGGDSFLPGLGRDGFGGRGARDGRDVRAPRSREDPRVRDPRNLRDPRAPRWPGGDGPGGRGAVPPGRGGRGQGRTGSDYDDWDRDDWDDGRKPRRKRGLVRILAPWVALAVIVTPLVIGALYVYHRYEAKYHPADFSGPGTGQVMVQVKNGDTAFSLAPQLVQLGVVASDRAFENAAEASGNTTGLEVGYYKLKHDMKASIAYAALLNPKNRVQTVVTIPEGKRVSQVIAVLAKRTKLPLKDFKQVVNHPAKLGLPSYAKGKVEGYLFPATYALQPHETALQILQAMVQRFKAEALHINIVLAARKVGLTPAQLIIEASMVQAEGGSVSDYPKIAAVIRNRIKAKMPLQFDSVLLYGLHKYGVNVTQAEINTKGPYNDWNYVGLPPGPICNPGDAAIQGILHPATGAAADSWLYFLTKSGGKSTFSATPLAGQ